MPTGPVSVPTAGAGGAGGAKAAGGAPAGGGAGGKGGAKAAGGAGGGEPLPTVDDPLKEAASKLNVGNYKDTIPFAKAAIKKDPENGDAYYYLGTAYQSMGQNDQALDVFDECVAKATKGQFLVWCKRQARKQ
ncbi:MAG: hypothetical protein DRI90_23020 [Deltaproteobacteria bacterium]|nr:MAG: hypothetical protein DRI90_23020 [Deltaproteobacteria bacterium]